MYGTKIDLIGISIEKFSTEKHLAWLINWSSDVWEPSCGRALTLQVLFSAELGTAPLKRSNRPMQKKCEQDSSNRFSFCTDSLTRTTHLRKTVRCVGDHRHRRAHSHCSGKCLHSGKDETDRNQQLEQEMFFFAQNSSKRWELLGSGWCCVCVCVCFENDESWKFRCEFFWLVAKLLCI